MNLDLKWSLWSRDAETFPAEALAALHGYGGNSLNIKHKRKVR